MMRFTVDARAFSDAMSKVSKVLRKSPLPILEEIAVHVKNGLCTLTATDFDTWLVAKLQLAAMMYPSFFPEQRT